MTYTVVEVVGAETIRVRPSWRWNESHGDLVRINGCATPEESEPQYRDRCDALENVVLGEEVELRNPVKEADANRVLSFVHMGGQNLANILRE